MFGTPTMMKEYALSIVRHLKKPITISLTRKEILILQHRLTISSRLNPFFQWKNANNRTDQLLVLVVVLIIVQSEWTNEGSRTEVYRTQATNALRSAPPQGTTDRKIDKQRTDHGTSNR